MGRYQFRYLFSVNEMKLALCGQLLLFYYNITNTAWEEKGMAVFKGAGVAIITPFHEDGSINYKKFTEIIEEQIAGGTDAIIVCGTTGEAATLTHEEHLDVIRHCVEVVKGRIPVVAGTGSNCTETAVYLSQEAEKIGADALLVVTPYYNKATQNGLFAHFKTVADSVKLPIILYNVPSRTGCNIQPQTLVRLCNEVSNIVGVKEASGNISQVAKIMSLANGKIDLYSGNDDQIVPLLSLGGKGVISVLSNVAPKQTHDICQKYFDGDVEGSMKEQLRAIELIDALFCEVNPIPVKTALNLMGKEVGPLHMPLSPMEPQNVEKLQNAMKAYGIL
jgi:4-hydroxy-tetrahydrodipicolinate synthase